MAQYPNDPGIDNQKPVNYTPTHEYEILTTDVFAAGMETQTKYSYQCAKQLMENAIKHTNSMNEEICHRIDNLSNVHQEDMTRIDDAFKNCYDAINAIKADCVELYRRTDNIRAELNEQITDYERRVLLSQIYDLV